MIQERSLRNITAQIFTKMGSSKEEAEIVANHLVDADLFGVDSHGVIRVPEYVSKIQGKSKYGFVIKPNASIRIEKESPSTVAVDGGSGFGQVVAKKTMEIAIEKAKISGICVATARNLDHAGRIGEFTSMAAKCDLIGAMFVKNPPAMQPFGGTARLIGNNPISYAFPTGNPDLPVSLDMAMSVAAGGKMRFAMDKGEAIPFGWIVDMNGNPTTDPSDYFDNGGSMLPLSGHKGYGLAIVTEILGGILSGAGALNENPTNNALFAFVVNIESFLPLSEFKSNIDKFISDIKNSPKKPGVGEIFLPGELEARTKERRLKEGIPLPEKTWQNIEKIADELRIER
jgi:hydroxycarboxylate dehydrogenase B